MQQCGGSSDLACSDAATRIIAATASRYGIVNFTTCPWQHWSLESSRSCPGFSCLDGTVQVNLLCPEKRKFTDGPFGGGSIARPRASTCLPGKYIPVPMAVSLPPLRLCAYLHLLAEGDRRCQPTRLRLVMISNWVGPCAWLGRAASQIVEGSEGSFTPDFSAHLAIPRTAHPSGPKRLASSSLQV